MNVDLTEIEPIERRVDTLLRAETHEGSYLLVVESQGKPDERKRGSWPYYLSYLHEKYRCEPVLIVVTQSSATARWAAEPIHLGVRGMPSQVAALGEDWSGLKFVRRAENRGKRDTK